MKPVIIPAVPQSFRAVQKRLAPLRQRVVEHRIYSRLTSIDALRTFVEHHAFAVWDFMSLLKELERRLTCVQVPWSRPADANLTRAIHEIVLAEESDCRPAGGFASHFELYLDAMAEIGADSTAVRLLDCAAMDGTSWRQTLTGDSVPATARAFVLRTLRVCERGSDWQVAADFVFGRENLIPDMFRSLVEQCAAAADLQVPAFGYYLDRHIGLDGAEQGPAGMLLLAALCGDDAGRWSDVEAAAVAALERRLALWDGVVAQLDGEIFVGVH